MTLFYHLSKHRHFASIPMRMSPKMPPMTIAAMSAPAPLFFGSVYILLSISLADGGERLSEEVAYVLRVDVARGDGIGGSAATMAVRMNRLMRIANFILVLVQCLSLSVFL
jgi:hypothetical protein